MENTISNLEKCRVIRDPKELNAEGCRFFMEADNIQPTFVSSTMLRWLTHENNGINYYTKEQEEAVKRIIAAQRREDMAPPFSMQILLYSDPRRLGENESRYIKALLQCVGVDARVISKFDFDFLFVKLFRHLPIRFFGLRVLVDESISWL